MPGRVAPDANVKPPKVARREVAQASKKPSSAPPAASRPPEDALGPARKKGGNLTGGRHKAVTVSIPGRPSAAPVSAAAVLAAGARAFAGAALAGASPSQAAAMPSSVTAEARNQWTLTFSPAITDERAARRAVFGSETVPPGLSLERKRGFLGEPGPDWTVRVEADPTRVAPNNLRWDDYQRGVRPEVQAFLSKHLPANLNVPKPGAAAPVLPDFDADQQAKRVKVTGWSQGLVIADTLKGPRMIDARTFDVDFGKKMTREQAAQFFWDQKKVPMNSTLEALPKGKEPASQWRVTQPENWTGDERAKGIHPTLGLHLTKQTSAENRQIPEWIGKHTRAALESKSLPPKGVEVTRPRPGIAVWREGNGVFWFDEKKKSFEAFPRTPGSGPGASMWNNWNTHYILKDGLSPREAGPRVVADMADTNRQMLLAFASALTSGKAPSQGGIAVFEQAHSVVGKFVDHPGIKGKDDLIDAARTLPRPTR